MSRPVLGRVLVGQLVRSLSPAEEAIVLDAFLRWVASGWAVIIDADGVVIDLGTVTSAADFSYLRGGEIEVYDPDLMAGVLRQIPRRGLSSSA